jgi:hypothetical protein
MLIVFGTTDPVFVDVVAEEDEVLLLAEVLVAVGIEAMPVYVPAAQVTMGAPAERYQLAAGSPRHSPTVTGTPQPCIIMVSSMNLVRL